MDLTETLPVPPLRGSLNQGQQVVHDVFVEYSRNPDTSKHPWWVLTGYAGTGKTYVTNNIVTTILNTPKLFMGGPPRIVLSAPTHKAVKVLRSNGTDNIDYATIHSLLGLREDINDKGVRKFVPSKDPEANRLSDYNVLILDEVSMLNSELFHIIEREKSIRPDLRIIFMGDPAQIPPVGEVDSIPLLCPSKYNIGTLSLTEVVRQAADSPVLAYATELRKSYKFAHTDPVQFEGEGSDSTLKIIGKSNETAIIACLEKYFCSPEFKLDADFMKVIAWQNNIVNIANQEIRRLIYKELAILPLVEGERLVLDQPYVYDQAFGRKLTTNTELLVKKVTPMVVPITYKLWEIHSLSNTLELNRYEYKVKVNKVLVEYENVFFVKKEVDIFIVDKEMEKGFEELLQRIADNIKAMPFNHDGRKAMWRMFYDLKDKFAKVKYNYAITAHKSQGSTYKNCMVLEWDINLNKRLEERNRIKYVAATRVKNNLYIVKA